MRGCGDRCTIRMMHADAERGEIRETTAPWPPCYRWLKRSLAIFAVVVALLIGLQLFWQHIADERLAAQIAAIHARGEPILPEDFKSLAIADSDNGAWYLRQAAAAIKHAPEAETLWDGWGIAYTDHEISDLTRWMDDEQAARSMARKARAHPIVAWNMKFGHPAITTVLPDLNTQRGLANTLGRVAFVEHHRGNDAEAVKAIRDLHFVADAMQQYSPLIISHMVGVGIDAVASYAVIDLSRDLSITDSSSTTRPGAGPASRAQVLQLIADLSDERQYRLGGIRSLYGERWIAVDAPNYILQNAMPTPQFYALRLAFKLDVINMLKAETQVSQAMGQPTLAAAMAMMPPKRPQPRGVAMLAHLLSSILLPSLSSSVEQHFRELTDHRAAVIALAIRLWRFDHAGRWPASLDELAPQYLAAVPVDPMSPTGAPFHFKLDAPGGAIIYSVGECGVDHGGSEQVIRKKTPGYPPTQWDKLNAVYHLTPQPPTTRPASN
jgi:hypothetical protein